MYSSRCSGGSSYQRRCGLFLVLVCSPEFPLSGGCRSHRLIMRTSEELWSFVSRRGGSFYNHEQKPASAGQVSLVHFDGLCCSWRTVKRSFLGSQASQTPSHCKDGRIRIRAASFEWKWKSNSNEPIYFYSAAFNIVDHLVGLPGLWNRQKRYLHVKSKDTRPERLNDFLLVTQLVTHGPRSPHCRGPSSCCWALLPEEKVGTWWYFCILVVRCTQPRCPESGRYKPHMWEWLPVAPVFCV